MSNIIQFPTSKRRRAIVTAQSDKEDRAARNPRSAEAKSQLVRDIEARSETTTWRHFQITTSVMPRTGKPTLMIYNTKSKARIPKPLVNRYYATVEGRDAALAEFKHAEDLKLERRRERKTARRAERREMKQHGHGIEVGDVLYASWGYDQTNVDFYQVVRVSAASVWFRKIQGEIVSGSRGCDNVRPVKDSFIDDHYRCKGTQRRTVRKHTYRGEDSYSVSFDRQSLNKTTWDAEHHQTASGWGH